MTVADLIYVNNRDAAVKMIDCIRSGKVVALYFIGSTLTSTIPGISIAGASPESTLYTPTLDVEYLVLGAPRSLNVIPMTPEGIPTPAIITRACLQVCRVPYLIVNCGTYVEPRIPHVRLPHARPGERIYSGTALPKDVVKGLLEDSRELAMMLARGVDVVLVGESIPGGTTTALGILVGLGYNAWGKVSSASPSNPHELKREVVTRGIERSGLAPSVSNDPLTVVSHLGDPVHISIASFVTEALRNNVKVVLAGGTQMAAVLALAKRLGADLGESVLVVTTRWIVADRSSDIVGLVRMIDPRVPVVAVSLDFSDAPYGGLRKYEEGYVKEGVGAGGTAFLAHILTGMSMSEIKMRVYAEYERLLRERQKTSGRQA